jgi:magnesium-transporting ATPase (P-type)
MAVSFGTMDWISGGVIGALVLLNVSVGAYTEWQAEKVSSRISPCHRFELISRPLRVWNRLEHHKLP